MNKNINFQIKNFCASFLKSDSTFLNVKFDRYSLSSLELVGITFITGSWTYLQQYFTTAKIRCVHFLLDSEQIRKMNK